MNFRPLKAAKINYSMYNAVGEFPKNKFNVTYMYYDTFITQRCVWGRGLAVSTKIEHMQVLMNYRNWGTGRRKIVV